MKQENTISMISFDRSPSSNILDAKDYERIKCTKEIFKKKYAIKKMWTLKNSYNRISPNGKKFNIVNKPWAYLGKCQRTDILNSLISNGYSHIFYFLVNTKFTEGQQCVNLISRS